jgi:hypothetical protein
MEASKTFKVPQVFDAPHTYPESMRRGGQVAWGTQLWVDGGWGIDALLDRQTRSHKDFDAIVAFEDLPALTQLLSGTGFQKYKTPC